MSNTSAHFSRKSFLLVVNLIEANDPLLSLQTMMQPPEHIEIYDTPLMRCWWGRDGILYSISKPGPRTIEKYAQVMELYAKLSDNGKKKFCVLGDITETRPLSKAVRDYVAAETGKYVKAMALVSASATGTATGSIYEMLSRTPYLVATFEDRDEAIRWLQQQLTHGPSSLDNAH